MSNHSSFLRHFALFLGVIVAVVAPAEAAFDNIWNFADASFPSVSGSGTMSFIDNSADYSMFTTPSEAPIGNVPNLYGGNGSTSILGFSAYAPNQGIEINLGSTANVADYTMMWDVLYPLDSDATYRPLLQTDISNTTDGDFFIKNSPSGGIGISSQYSGVIVPETWNRIVITKESSSQTIQKYINGVQVGVFAIPAGEGGAYNDRWDLQGGLYSILTDDDNETATGYIASHRVLDRVMSNEEVFNLGGVHAGGCGVAGVLPPTVPEMDTVWNFNGNLNAVSGGTSVMTYRGDTASSTSFGATADFGLPALAGDNGTAKVMAFPATTGDQGFQVTRGTDLDVNSYTMIWDILYPTASDGVYRALYQTTADNSNDADFFVGSSGGIGITSVYDGAILPDTWHRVAITIDGGMMTKYIDGLKVGEQTAEGRHTLTDNFFLFLDDDGETAAGYLASYRFMTSVLTEAEIAELGGVNAAGTATGASPKVPGDANNDGKVDGSDVTILAGNWQVLSGANWGMGDFNADGKVDGSDVTILAGNWQYGVTAAAASVPEPSVIALLITGLVGLFTIRRRK